MTPFELRALIADGAAPTILDVRTTREFVAGHVPGATHIPFQSVSRRMSEIPSPPDAPIVIYCGHGPRAWLAARALRSRGFQRVTYLAGHWAAWVAANLPTERPVP